MKKWEIKLNIVTPKTSVSFFSNLDIIFQMTLRKREKNISLSGKMKTLIENHFLKITALNKT